MHNNVVFNKAKPLKQNCETQLLSGKAALQWLYTKALECSV